MVSTVNDVEEILFSFPLVIKQSVGSVVRGQFSNTLPTIGFPFDNAANSMKLSDAIATVLCLAISFNLGDIRAFVTVFNGAGHGLCLVGTMVRNEGAVSSPQLHFLTEGSATIGIGKPFLLAFAGFLGQSFPLLGQLFRFNDGACWHLDGAIEGGNGPLVCHGAIEVPSFADVQQAIHFQLAGVSSAHAGLNGERLVPSRHCDSEANGVEPVECCVGVSGGELLDGVIDAGHS